jgi:hypothetical protein
MTDTQKLVLQVLDQMGINPEDPELPDFDKYTALDVDLLQDASNLLAADTVWASQILFPFRNEGRAHEGVLALISFMTNKASELQHSFQGDDEKAKLHAGLAELAYDKLPVWARWRKNPDWPEAKFEGEVYCFLTTRFDVEVALQIVEGREPVVIDIKSAVSALVFNAINKKHAETVDLTKPLLIADIASIDDKAREEGRPCYIPIDGWHRIWKAHRDGITELPAVFLTRDETDHIVDSPF